MDPSIEERLVRSDALLEAGDARGQFIALQFANQVDPSPALQKRLDAYERRHHAALFGPVLTAKQADHTWLCGYFDTLSLCFQTARQAEEFIATLGVFEGLDHLRTLAIEVTKSADYAALEATLVQHAKPETLRQLTLGGQVLWSPALVQAFPEMQANADWQQVRASLRTETRLGADCDLTQRPVLRPLVEDTAYDLEELVIGMRAELEKGRDHGLVRVLPLVFTADSIDRWLASFLGNGATKWALEAAPSLGGDHSAAALGERVIRENWGRSIKPLLARLAHLDSPVRAVVLWHTGRANNAGGKAARKALDAVAASTPGGRIALLDKTLPAELPQRVATAYRALIPEWIERIMIGRHTLDRNTVRFGVGVGPRAEAACTMIWGCFDGDACVQTFMLQGTDFVDLVGQPVVPLTDGIGVPHPLDLDRETREAWLDRLQTLSVVQAVPQLRRPIQRLRRGERGGRRLTRYGDCLRAAGRAQSELWVRWEGYDHDTDMQTSGVRLELQHRGQSYVFSVRWGSFYSRKTSATLGRGPTLGALPRVVASELLAGMGTMVATAEIELGVDATGPSKPCAECGVPVPCEEPRVWVQRCRHERQPGAVREFYKGVLEQVPLHWRCAPWCIEVQLEQQQNPGVLQRLRSDFEALGVQPPVRGAVTTEPVRSSSPNPLTEAAVLARCPDAKAVRASRAMAKLSKFDRLGQDGSTAWGSALGSQTYTVSVSLIDESSSCTCPSRKVPCKHVIGLLLLVAWGELPA